MLKEFLKLITHYFVASANNTSPMPPLMVFSVDGEPYVSMYQARDTIFKDMSHSALKTFMSRHKVRSIMAKGDCRQRLEGVFGPKKGGHFIIKQSDAQGILRKRNSTLVAEPEKDYSSPQAITTLECMSRNEFRHCNTMDGLGSFLDAVGPAPILPTEYRIGTAETETTSIIDKEFPPMDTTGDVFREEDAVVQALCNMAGIFNPPPCTAAAAAAASNVTCAEECPADGETAAMPTISIASVPSTSAYANATTTEVPSERRDSSETEFGSSSTDTSEMDRNKKSSCEEGSDSDSGSANSDHEEGTLEKEFEKMQRFYTKTLNPERRTRSLNGKSTMKKAMQRINAYSQHVQIVKKRQPHLKDYSDVDLVTEFSHWLLEKKGLKTGTVAGYVQAIMYASKYSHRTVAPSGNFDGIPVIGQLRNLQSELQVCRNIKHKSVTHLYIIDIFDKI